MTIHVLPPASLTDRHKKDLTTLLKRCRSYEPITLGIPEDGDLYLLAYAGASDVSSRSLDLSDADSHLPDPSDADSHLPDPSDAAGKDPDSRLLACLILCKVQEDLWECYAFTRPDSRRQGIFSRLFQKACQEAEEQEAITNTEIDLVFLSDGKSPEGLAAAQAFEFSFWYAEYQMELEIRHDPHDPEGPEPFETTVPSKSSDCFAASGPASLPALHQSLTLRRETIQEEEGITGWIYYAYSDSASPAVGTCRLIPYDDTRYYLYHVEIRPELRSQGWGTRLLNALLTRLPDGTVLTLQVSSANEPALRLYQKAGFRITETLSYYLS